MLIQPEREPSELRMMTAEPNLEFHHPALHDQAIAAWKRGDISMFFISAKGKETWMHVLLRNIEAIREGGLYEVALYEAFIGTRTNNHHVSVPLLKWLFKSADRARLRACGDLL